LLWAAACAPTPGVEARALYELERLAFVPPARCTLDDYTSWPFADCSLDRAIVFDRFELTRGDRTHYLPTGPGEERSLTWTTDAARDAPDRVDWPAYMDFREAQAIATLRGMRLPTPREWIHVAVGRRGFAFPWGGRDNSLWANTRVVQKDEFGQRNDVSLKSPWTVGSFENGRSRPFGCYDLLGNVWEWVDGVVPGDEPPLATDPRVDELDDSNGTVASVLGGAFDTPLKPTFRRDGSRMPPLRFHARRLDKRTLSPSIGARMCADAEPYLWQHAAEWGEGEDVRQRVRDVARRWAEDALARDELRSLLAELCARPAAPAGILWLREGLEAGP